MERGRNPYTPNAGAPPRFLAGGRTEDFRVLLQRLGRGYTEKSLVITGLRGGGQTVLLGQYHKIAAEENWGRGGRGSLPEHAVRTADGESRSTSTAADFAEGALGRAR